MTKNCPSYQIRKIAMIEVIKVFYQYKSESLEIFSAL